MLKLVKPTWIDSFIYESNEYLFTAYEQKLFKDSKTNPTTW